MTKLRVLAGPDANNLTPISHLVNTSQTHHIRSSRFDGLVTVHVKGFVGTDGKTKDSPYFINNNDNNNDGDRRGVTWSIQVTGRFLVDGLTMDDVLFGNTFDRPLKLPWGSGAALKFMNYIDPTLEHALESDKPWALSPLIATMPYFAISKSPTEQQQPSFSETNHTSGTPQKHLVDSTSALSSYGVPTFKSPSARRTYFSSKPHRQAIPIDPGTDVITTDFAYGFLSFPEIRLNLPGGVSFDLMNYWDGQPVRFVCCERRRGGHAGEESGESSASEGSRGSGSVASKGSAGSRGSRGVNGTGRGTNGNGKNGLKGPGEPFWVVVFEAVLDDHEEGSDVVPMQTPDRQVPLEEQVHLREDID